MVLLTYRSGATTTVVSSTEEDASENERIVKDDVPKTPYIDKLEQFREDDILDEKCDLYFICKDGEIPAHRLVISNVSKFIMTMQDDQPLWFPVYISVPDLTKEIVQTLVQLAYTGKMNLPPSTSTDELLDAMQALGWVNQDNLTASYTDSMNPLSDEDIGTGVSTKTAESLETVLKMSFPRSTKVEAEESDDENGMEVDLPDVPLSEDEEVKKKTPSPKKKKVVKKEPENSRRSTRSGRSNVEVETPVETKPEVVKQNSSKPQGTKKPAMTKTKVAKSKVATTPPVKADARKTRQKNDKASDEVETSPPVKPNARKTKNITEKDKDTEEAQPSPPVKSTSRKTKRNNDTDVEAAEVEEKSVTEAASEKSPAKEVTTDLPSMAELEPVRSRTRTIRKPKKFDDAIVLTPTKRKESPTKTPSKPLPKPVKKSETTADDTEKSTSSKATPNTTKRTPARARRVTTEENPEAISKSFAKITEFFKPSKNDNEKTSKDNENSVNLENDKSSEGNDLKAKSSEAEANDLKAKSSETNDLNASEAEEKSDQDVPVTDNGVDNGESTEKKENAEGGKEVNTVAVDGASSLRGRTRSRASSKGDKDSKDEASTVDSTTTEAEDVGTTTVNSNKRNHQEDDDTLKSDTVTPAKRGRKASNISNASKASNKDADT